MYMYVKGTGAVWTMSDSRGQIIQTGAGQVNDNLMELLISISACKTASARKVRTIQLSTTSKSCLTGCDRLLLFVLCSFIPSKATCQ